MLPRILGVILAFGLVFQVRAEPLFADEFDDVAPWTAAGSDGVLSRVARDTGADGKPGGSLRVNFDFQRGSGFAVFRRDVDIDLPPNWRITFDVRGECLSNNFEFKLIDETGDNVWWVNKRGYEFPTEWTPTTLKKRHFSFAWGPGGAGKGLTKVRGIEIAVAAGSGGKGSVWIDGLRFEEAEEVVAGGAVKVRVSSSAEEGAPPEVLPEDGVVNWRSAASDLDPWIELDFAGVREFGGVTLEWGDSFPLDYDLELRNLAGESAFSRGSRFTNGGVDHVALRDGEGASLRVMGMNYGEHAVSGSISLRRVLLRELSFGESPNSFVRAIAGEVPPGDYPRAFFGQQVYWTVVGLPNGEQEALVGEDGAVEFSKGGPSVEPFLKVDGRVVTWAQCETAHSLAGGSLPIPTVRLTEGDLALDVTAFAHSTENTGRVCVIYKLSNLVNRRVSGELALAVRPFQVLPLTQELNMVGGVFPLRSIGWSKAGGALFETPGGAGFVLFSPTPDDVDMSHFASGGFVERFRTGERRKADGVTDPQRLASAAAIYSFDLGPGESIPVTLESTFLVELERDIPSKNFSVTTAYTRLEECKSMWREALDRVSFSLPPFAQRYADTFRSQIAYILINRDGPAIQPGSRSYDRTWIRDGALTSTALLYAGHPEEVRAFIDWFAPFQYESGKVPCCADERGPDPVPEHDSHGEFIYAVAEYDRFMHDNGFLRSHVERVAKAVGYIETLRGQRMTDEYKNGVGIERAKYGLVPESISHEGYSAKPMHSYWDDFWVLRGLEDAAYIGGRLGDGALEARASAAAGSMRKCLYDSMRLAMSIKGIDHIPGCVELGDFDATSTSIGVFPIGELGQIPEPHLTNTFDRYAKWFDDRAEGRIEWKDYTPYEIRNTTTFLFLGRRDVTHRMMEFFFKDQRPAGWNAWAEVVRNGYRTPGFIGDLPHTWVGSDFVKLLRTMFVHERVSDGALVVGMGITKEWIEAEGGASAQGLPTHFGGVGLSFFMRDGARVVSIAGELSAPAGGVEIALEGLEGAEISVDGKRVWLNDAGRLVVAWPVREVVIRGGW